MSNLFFNTEVNSETNRQGSIFDGSLNTEGYGANTAEISLEEISLDLRLSAESDAVRSYIDALESGSVSSEDYTEEVANFFNIAWNYIKTAFNKITTFLRLTRGNNNGLNGVFSSTRKEMAVLQKNVKTVNGVKTLSQNDINAVQKILANKSKEANGILKTNMKEAIAEAKAAGKGLPSSEMNAITSNIEGYYKALMKDTDTIVFANLTKSQQDLLLKNKETRGVFGKIGDWIQRRGYSLSSKKDLETYTKTYSKNINNITERIIKNDGINSSVKANYKDYARKFLGTVTF